MCGTHKLTKFRNRSIRSSIATIVRRTSAAASAWALALVSNVAQAQSAADMLRVERKAIASYEQNVMIMFVLTMIVMSALAFGAFAFIRSMLRKPKAPAAGESIRRRLPT